MTESRNNREPQTDTHDDEQHALEHALLRSLVESEGNGLGQESQETLRRLRTLCRERGDAAERARATEVDPFLLAFGTAVITAGVAALIRFVEYLLAPPQGTVVLLNPGPPITVRTYDEGDGVRWIAYQEKRIETNQATPLTARGANAIQIVVVGRPGVHTCRKNQPYRYDGVVMVERTA